VPAVVAGSLMAAVPARGIDTRRSFTISAWVNLTRVGGSRTLVGQAGHRAGAFSLRLRGGRFVFRCRPSNRHAGSSTLASAGSIVPQPGEWYQLTGVYDAARRAISLYVNGRLQQTRGVHAISRTGRPVGASRRFDSGFRGRSVLGRVDEVRTYATVLSGARIARLAGPGVLTVDASKVGPAINSTQFGVFMEEINHAGDGGLDGQLIRNSDLRGDLSDALSWQAVNSAGGQGSISIDGSHPLNHANPISLKLSIGNLPLGGRVGVANIGYWGIPVEPSTSYQVSFFARSDRPATGPLTVDLESNGGQVWASATIPGITNRWAEYSTALTTGPLVAPSLSNRFVISTSDPAAAGSTLWFTIVTVFPPSYDAIQNGLRSDLMGRIAALHPGYFRLPGGNYLEGDSVNSRFDWSDTVGPLQDRPGHFDTPWGYWSDDYMGLLEYLEAAEEVGAAPLLSVWDGYALNGTVVPQDQLEPYVQDALDEIHYAVDPITTTWGAMRAADGHPAPFELMGVEIGNEDGKDRSGSYNAYRYPMFYDAIKAAFPGMPVVATTPVTSRPIDILDEHFYNEHSSWFADNAHRFDNVSRTGPKVLVGEYAVTPGPGPPTLADALGEAAFLTGLERDADVVIGASYAPLLGNVNDLDRDNILIGYNGLSSYGSPSYYALKMLSTQHGDHVVGSQVVSGPGTLFDVVSQDVDHTYIAVINDGPLAAPTRIKLTGVSPPSSGTATVLAGDPAATNSLTDPTRVTPRTTVLDRLRATFTYTFAPSSVTVLQLDS
jgi:alpha-L-arabinofuranosidase